MVNGISFLGLDISWYSILGVTGLVVAAAMCVLRKNKHGIPTDDIINLAGYAIVGSLIGSKLLALLCAAPAIISNWDKLIWNWELINLLLSTGFVYYGGLLGVVVMFYIYSRQFKVDFRNITEMLAPAVPCFHIFGRIGCYITGCCYGIGHFPIQIVESAMNLAICVILIIIQNKNIAKGKTFILYMFMYGVGRFILEFFRGDPERGFIGPLSVSQWISAVVIIIGVILWNRRKESE